MQALGHEVVVYQLDGRIESAGAFYHYLYNREKRLHRQGKRDEPPKPVSAQIAHLATAELVNMALYNDVDVVLIFSAMYVPYLWLPLLKRANRRIGVIFSESPYDDKAHWRYAETADICWTNERTSVDVLRYANPHTYYLPHAVSADLATGIALADAEEDAPSHDVVFVGTLFQERIETLSAVNWEGIDFGLYGAHDLLPHRHRLRQHTRSGYITNARAIALYRKAKIGLNLYRTSMGFGTSVPRTTAAESMNARALDLAACGVFTISDYRPEMVETFGALVPTFRTPAELEYQIRSWLSQDAGRAQYAAGLPPVVTDHTYAARARQLLDDLARCETGPVHLRDQPLGVG